jgi:hypothetical protein
VLGAVTPKAKGYHMSIRDLILQKQDRETRDVYVKDWDINVRMRALTGAERDDFEASVDRMGPKGQRIRNTRNIRARLVAKCIIDQETGDLAFKTPEDIAALGDKSAKAIDFLFDVAAEMNGMSADDVKSLEGNSDDPDGSETLT